MVFFCSLKVRWTHGKDKTDRDNPDREHDLLRYRKFFRHGSVTAFDKEIDTEGNRAKKYCPLTEKTA